MSAVKNPFEFDAAPNLEPSQLIDWFIEDHNFSRFIESTKNVLIDGERGSGKSMALIYRSLRYVQLRKLADTVFAPSHIGIYVPCNTPLNHKQEYKLLSEIEQALLSESYFVYGIAMAIAKELESVSNKISEEDEIFLKEEFSYILDYEESDGESSDKPSYLLLKRLINKRLREQQSSLQRNLEIDFNFETSSFFTLIVPLLEALKRVSIFQKPHISLLIDDAHDLNPIQQKLLNSWLSYRDHSIFSFKVAIAGYKHYNLQTSSGGTILEGHDFVTINFEQPLQNEVSPFGKFASDVVEKRLNAVGVTIAPEAFFPSSETFEKEIEICRQKARKEAISKGYTDAKVINDYVYKQARAIYFRERSPKAGRPIYAGFETLLHLSNGVIRNLLEPCHRMYDAVISNGGSLPNEIPSGVQSTIILDKSTRLWEFVENKLALQIEGCSNSDAVKIHNLLIALAELFRDRLKNYSSEPRVLTFSISKQTDETRASLEPIFKLMEKAQLLFIRKGRAKDGGGKEDYHSPNRYLWPEYGLDVHGQHGRVSIKAEELIAALDGSSLIKISPAQDRQKGLFE